MAKRVNPGYHKGAVDKAIHSSRQKIGGREARAIHRVLSAPTVADAMRVGDYGRPKPGPKKLTAGSPGGGVQFSAPDAGITDHSNVEE